MIRITAALAIDEREIEESFIRASGPGGQNVNKVSSAVQLRFDAGRSPRCLKTYAAASCNSPAAVSPAMEFWSLMLRPTAPRRATVRKHSIAWWINSPRLCCAPSAAGHKTNQGVARAAH